MIRVRAVIDQDLEEPIVKELLNKFVDWLDGKGLLREGNNGLEYEYNSELTDKFVEEYE